MPRLVLPVLCLLASVAHADPVEATWILGRGDVLADGSEVLWIGDPVLTAEGDVVFTVRAERPSGDDVWYLWSDDGPLWSSEDEPVHAVSGLASRLGATSDGRFVVRSTNIDGTGGVFGHQGVVALEGADTPAFPPGTPFERAWALDMDTSGTAWWTAETQLVPGVLPMQQALIRMPDGDPALAEIVVATGDTVDGLVLDPDRDWSTLSVSPSGAHVAMRVDFQGVPVSEDHGVWMDGSIVAREGDAVVSGGEITLFDSVAVNDAGLLCLVGRVAGLSTRPDVALCDGEQLVRQGDRLLGATLGAGPVFVQPNGAGHVAWAWDLDGAIPDDGVFVTCDPHDVLGTTRRVLRTGDEVDLDGDGVGDEVLRYLLGQANQSPQPYADDGTVYLEVAFESTVLASVILAVDAGCCDPADDGDGDGICDVDDLCDGNDALGDADGDGICDVAGPEIEVVGTASPGAELTLFARGFVPGSDVRVYGARSLGGRRPCLPDGTCTELRGPRYVLFEGLADPVGVLRGSVVLPDTLPVGTTLYTQALGFDGVDGRVSDPVAIVVVP